MKKLLSRSVFNGKSLVLEQILGSVWELIKNRVFLILKIFSTFSVDKLLRFWNFVKESGSEHGIWGN